MSFGIKELIVILIIVMLVFGTKKIRNVGGDVGGWIKDFRKALKEGGDSEDADAKGRRDAGNAGFTKETVELRSAAVGRAVIVHQVSRCVDGMQTTKLDVDVRLGCGRAIQ